MAPFLCSLRLADGAADLLDDRQVGVVKEMHIDLCRGRGAAVAQGFADAEEGDVAAVGDAGKAVAQAMERDIGQVCLLQHPLKPVAEIVRLIGLPAAVADDKPLI